MTTLLNYLESTRIAFIVCLLVGYSIRCEPLPKCIHRGPCAKSYIDFAEFECQQISTAWDKVFSEVISISFRSPCI
jgi:hypothetical protein